MTAVQSQFNSEVRLRPLLRLPEGADAFTERNQKSILFTGHPLIVALVLLCYKKSRRQQGHRGRERARCAASWQRRVAMEQGL